MEHCKNTYLIIKHKGNGFLFRLYEKNNRYKHLISGSLVSICAFSGLNAIYAALLPRPESSLSNRKALCDSAFFYHKVLLQNSCHSLFFTPFSNKSCTSVLFLFHRRMRLRNGWIPCINMHKDKEKRVWKTCHKLVFPLHLS